MENLELVLPEVFISISIMFLLIFGVFKNNSSKLIQNISSIVLLISAVIIFNETLSVEETKIFNNSVTIDYLSSIMKIITSIAAFIALVISSNYLKVYKIYKIDNDLIFNHKVNRNHTFRDQQQLNRRPRFSLMKEIIIPNQIKPIIDDNITI